MTLPTEATAVEIPLFAMQINLFFLELRISQAYQSSCFQISIFQTIHMQHGVEFTEQCLYHIQILLFIVSTNNLISLYEHNRDCDLTSTHILYYE